MIACTAIASWLPAHKLSGCIMITCLLANLIHEGSHYKCPPSQHQKRVHMDAFLVSACSPPLEDQKHAHGGVFLVFGGFLPHPLQADTSRKPKARPWGRVSGFQHPHLPPLPSPTCQTRKTHPMRCVFRVWHAQNTKTANTFAFFVFCG